MTDSFSSTDRTSGPRRNTFSPATIAIALLALLAGLLLVAAAPADARKKAPSDFFGMFAEADSEADYEGPGKAGFGAFRVPVNWGAIQKTRDGVYDWTSADRGVYYSAKHGMRPALVMFGTPRFVGKSKKGFVPPRSKQDLREWEEFAAAAAARYGRGGSFYTAYPELAQLHVRTWVAWNEQNAVPYWVPKPNPKAYAKLLTSFSRGVRGADPEATIVTGGMYGYPRASTALTAVKFLRKLYAVKGIKKHFDAVGLHPYGPEIKDVKKQITAARKVMKKAGDGGAGVFVGEVGWASKGPRNNSLVVGKKKQSQMLSKSLQLMLNKRNAWNLTGAYVYTWRDFTRETTCIWCPGAGLVTEGGKPKPALKAVKKILRRSR